MSELGDFKDHVLPGLLEQAEQRGRAKAEKAMIALVGYFDPAGKPTAMARPTLESVIRGAFDEFMNAKGGWDGDFEPVIAAVVEAVRSYFDHDFAGDISKAVERELHRIMGEK